MVKKKAASDLEKASACARDARTSREEKNELSVKDDAAILTVRSRTTRTLSEALAASGTDLTTWKVERHLINKWDCVAKSARPDGPELLATELWQVKVWLVPVSPFEKSLESLLEQMKRRSERVGKTRPRASKRCVGLELSVMDPHFGLACKKPSSDQNWDPDQCYDYYVYAHKDLIDQGKRIAHANKWTISEISFPFGNDLLHVDNLIHTTTVGTFQAETSDIEQSYVRAELAVIESIDEMLKLAPVKAFQIPGNHDNYSSFTMGRVINAWYHKNANFHVDATCNQYKCWMFGSTLIGYEHGSSINPIRLAALMANEWPEEFHATSYHEWHLGDQHRRGASKPSAFEEQGVSIDFLPGLVVPNKWHRKKAFNFQKRAATAFLVHPTQGVRMRINSNIDKYTGEFMK